MNRGGVPIPSMFYMGVRRETFTDSNVRIQSIFIPIPFDPGATPKSVRDQRASARTSAVNEIDLPRCSDAEFLIDAGGEGIGMINIPLDSNNINNPSMFYMGVKRATFTEIEYHNSSDLPP